MEPLLEGTHQQQIARDRTAGLLRAGIGKAYHRRRLAELGGVGATLTKWVMGDADADVFERGRGWSIVGPGADSYDATLLLARGLFVRGVTVQIVPLRRLIRMLDRNREDTESINDCAALFITDFVQDYAGGIVPISGWEIMSAEEYLGHRLDNNRSVFLHACRPLDPKAAWWSANLLHRLAQKNQTLVVEAI
jgi:hypothetical protein